MRRLGPNICWLGLCVLLVLLVLSASGPVMRESDQASLLDGAVRIARSGEVADQEFYNYDKQFGSYWALAILFRVTDLDVLEVDPAAVVSAGNRFASILFSIGLLAAFAMSWRRDFSFIPLLLATVLTPVVVFTVPLLSSNVLSAAMLCALAAALRVRKRGWGHDLLCAALAAMAVGFRADAVLVLPLLCLLNVPRLSWAGLLGDRRHWTMLVAALGALVLGREITKIEPYNPGVMFDLRLYGAYVVFGLAGAGLLLLWIPSRIFFSGVRRKAFWRIALAGSFLLPLGYYSLYLYTPRHLFLSGLIPLWFVISLRGERWWRVLYRQPFTKVVIWSAVVVSAFLWVGGLRFRDFSKFTVVGSDPTTYPTADGFWPMGCYREFMGRLAHAQDRPIDYNQELWNAWRKADLDSLPEGQARIHSGGNRSYGRLRLLLAGREVAKRRKTGDYDLVSDRGIGRKLTGFERDYVAHRIEIDWENCDLAPISPPSPQRIYLVHSGKGRTRSLGEKWVASLQVAKSFGGDDYRLAGVHEAREYITERYHNYQIALVYDDIASARGAAERFERAGAAKVKVLPIEGVDEAGGVVTLILDHRLTWGELTKDGPRWIARSVLPAFMSVSNYKKTET